MKIYEYKMEFTCKELSGFTGRFEGKITEKDLKKLEGLLMGFQDNALSEHAKNEIPCLRRLDGD